MKPLLAMCLCLCACKSESVSDVVAKHQPGVEKIFATLRALGPKVVATEELTAAKVEAPAAPLLLEKPKSDEDNAMFVYADDLENPAQAAPGVMLRTLDSLPLLHCGALISNGTLFGSAMKVTSPSVAKGYLSACERLRFVLVIRGREFKAPQPAQGDTKFVSGLFRADVLAFDLSTGASLGGFPVSAKNDEQVNMVAGEDQGQRLLHNLEAAIFEAVREGARKAFPGSLPPPAH
jgi:hypothetical protein